MEYVLFFFIVGFCFDFYDFYLKSVIGFLFFEMGVIVVVEVVGVIFVVILGI